MMIFNIDECECWSQDQCIYRGYSDCKYGYLMPELPEWYKGSPLYEDIVNLDHYKKEN